MNPTREILRKVFRERVNQIRTWGSQDHPDIADAVPVGWESWATPKTLAVLAGDLGREARARLRKGPPDWTSIFLEEVGEVFEALLTHDREALAAELIQVSAVAAAWAEALLARGDRDPGPGYIGHPFAGGLPADAACLPTPDGAFGTAPAGDCS